MQVIDLKKEYKIKNGTPVHALKGVSLALPQKGMVFILGKSGSGKSTLLKLLAGLETPTEGQIIFNGRKISDLDKNEQAYYRNAWCGFVFQEYNIIPELTVEENISLALEMQGERDTETRVKETLLQVELAGYEKRRISELSGGQKQRVAIARALIKQPEIIFADEPTGALDSKTSEAILSLFKKLSQEKLVVIVTHEREFAEKFGDRIIELADGKIVKDTEENFSQSEKREEKEFSKKQAKLPLKTIFKMGSSNFQYHPFRLLIVIFLSTLSFALFGISYAFARADVKDVSLKAMQTLNVTESALYKNNGGRLTPITDEDYTYITNTYSVAALRILASDIEVEEIESETLSAYASVLPSAYAFVKEEDLTGYGLSYIGTFAKNENEVMLTEYTANQLLTKDASKESLIGSELTIDGTRYLITAIIDTHFDEIAYESLKTVTGKLSSHEKMLFDELSRELIGSRHTAIYFARNALSEEMVYSQLLFSLQGVDADELSSLYEFSLGEDFFYMENTLIQDVNDVFETVGMLSKIVLILSIVLGLFSIALLIYFISQSVEEKYGTVAILKTMGAGDWSIMQIFLWEGLLLGLVIFIASAILSALGCGVLNGIFATTTRGVLPIFAIGFFDILTLFALIIGCSALGGILPIRKINHAKAIDYLER